MLEARVNKQQPAKVITKTIGTPKKFDVELLLPPPPPPPPMSPTKSISPISSDCNSYNSCDQDLPLPPPPSPLKIPSSILTPPLSSDENDLPQKSICKKPNLGNNGNDCEKVNYRNKKNFHSIDNNNQSSDSHNNNGPSAFSVNKAELSTKARDRRSYIERNNNEMPLNGNVDALDATKIADGLANGQHPVCDKCKCKITR